MTNHKNIDRICAIIGVVTILIGFVFSYYGNAIGITAGTADLSYVTKLFDDSSVHTINIEISAENWNSLQENATDEEYELCDVTVDGETLDNVAIRPKGNSSLSSVASTDSERYSFKIDFDKYNDSLSYHGLDKLNLNNIISDNTYLKDYLSYDMMEYMGVDAPLTSFVKVSVNGEYFGLYLAVEGVEEAFVTRNYGTDEGTLYKPDSMAMGGDRVTNMPTMPQGTDTTQTAAANQNPGQSPSGSQMPSGGQPPDLNQTGDTAQTTDAANDQTKNNSQLPDISQMGNMFGESGDDVALIYSDDELSSYENIWNGAIFDVTTSDKERLIDSIKQLNEGENLEAVVDVEEVLKYFVVHNFVDNYDSYTGSMKHNYYLREEDGQMSIVAWDYNLAFSNFMGGVGGEDTTTTATNTDEATTLVNYPIDTPVSGTTMAERPLLNELLSNETYLAQYHQYYEEFIAGYFESGRCAETIDKAVALISADVNEDPTKFCSYEEYQAGVAVLKQFCELRAESISGQLVGTIPATTTGQTEQPTTLINASILNVSAMGSNAMGGGMNKGMGMPTSQTTAAAASTDTTTGTDGKQQVANASGGGQPAGNRPGSDATSSATTNQSADGSQAATDSATQNGQASTMPGNGGNMPTNAGGTVDWTAIIVIAASVLLLGVAILVTKLYRR
ncbi:MAG: CotH kinase family protein [Firmicutes bacterium]|nr:CotH kinase family protein [Bacillota bacterium]